MNTNDTTPDSFIQLVARQVELSPDQVAIVDEQGKTTYASLSARFSELARNLRMSDVGPEQRVAVFLPRGADAIVSVLGILRAGAAYVPLDLRDPEARLGEILRDAKVCAVITDSSCAGLLPDIGSTLILAAPNAGGADVLADSDPFHIEADIKNLAYILYTSGSTGKPQGVLVQNDSLINLLNGLHEDVYRCFGNRRLRVGLNAPLSFDASVKQLLCLALGHTLYVLPENTRRDAAALGAYIERHQLDVLDCTPSQLQVLYAGGYGRAVAKTMLLVGGEPLRDALWESLAGKPQPCFNVYGPTECTVDSTVCSIDRNTKPSIGRALSTARVYLLDSSLRLAPSGVPGEIFISGAGVSRGYNSRPDLTAERFLPDPFTAEAGSRMYRSGDRGRYCADGLLEYLGRGDRQVKLRGIRVEPGEIEAILESHEGVVSAAVVLRNLGDRGECLVAYVVPADGGPNADALKEYAERRLPEYMLPASITFLQTMPMTANGKRDLSQLPAPTVDNSDLSSDEHLQGSPIELALVRMWKSALQVPNVGIHDDFFALGGHSLLATRLIAPLQDICETDTPLLTLFFMDPTIAGLAQALSESSLGARHMDDLAAALLQLDLVEAEAEDEDFQYPGLESLNHSENRT